MVEIENMTEEEKKFIEQAAEETIQKYLRTDTSHCVADHGLPHRWLPHTVKTRVGVTYRKKPREVRDLYKEYAAELIMKKWEERKNA